MKTKFIEFNEEYKWYDIDNKLKLLKSYIHILENSGKMDDVNYDTAKTYFIIIHNWLIIERMFYDEIVQANKELNKNLSLEKLSSDEEVMDKFFELYEPNHLVRFATETFDSIQPIREYLDKKGPQIYKNLMKK